ncbi:MAG: glycine oxidase ThiO [bacterium]
METADLGIVGGGTIGLALAGRLAQHFERVVLFDRKHTCREATYASGGMLAPFMETEFGEEDLLELNRRSLERFPDFVSSLRQATRGRLGYRRNGSLFVAVDEQQVTELNRLARYQSRLGLSFERLSQRQLRRQVSHLSESVETGIYFEAEGHINNRLLGLALRQRAQKRGVDLRINDPVEVIEYGEDGRVNCLRTRRGSVQVSRLIIAAGAWSGKLNGLKERDSLPVRPVKGQAFSVRPDPKVNLDTIVRSPNFYCVPHDPERIIVGASVEEKGFTPGNTAGEIMTLLEQSSRVIPGLRDCPLQETWSGDRPAPLDNKPIIGPSSVTPNLYFATGHYRNGILLTPITEKLLSQTILDGQPPSELKPFLPGRFQQPSRYSGSRTA